MGINKGHLSRIKVFLRDKDKKSYLKISKEVLELWVLKKQFPLFYFGRFLYRKGMVDYKYYLNLKEYYSIIQSKKLNKKEYTSILGNKLSFSFFCKMNNIPTPNVVGYNMQRKFIRNGKRINLNSQAELKSYLLQVFSEIKKDKLFIKTLSDSGGKGVFLFERSTLDKQLDRYGKKILENATIHQEAIEQHKDINKIYAQSVNTIRIDTYIDNSNISHILSATMRVGSEGSVVDNVSSGGFYIPIDLVSGQLTKYSIQSMKHGGRNLTKHPNTNFEFSGFKVPFMEEAKSICIELCEILPNRLIGWDIAIGPNGPIVIEGNPEPGINIGESIYGGYLKHPLYKEILATVK